MKYQHQQQQREKDSSYLQQIASLGKGFVSGALGGTADIASSLYNIPAYLHNLQIQMNPDYGRTLGTMGGTYADVPVIPIEPEPYEKAQEKFSLQQLPYIPSATEAIERKIEDWGGETFITPKEMDNLYEGAKLAGSVAGMGGMAKIAGKAGKKGLEKVAQYFGSTLPSDIATAGVAGTTMSALDEAEVNPLISLGAGAATGSLSKSALKNISKATEGLLGTLGKEGYETLGEMTIGRALAQKGDYPKTAIEIAKREGIILPFNVALQTPFAHKLADHIRDSLVISKEYKDIIQKADRDMINKFVSYLDTVGPKDVGKHASSRFAQEALNQEAIAVKNKAEDLYNTAYQFLKPEEVSVSDLKKGIQELKTRFGRSVAPAEADKFVLKKLNEIEKGFNLDVTNKVDIDQLIGLRESLGREIQWGEIGGIKNSLLKIIGDIDKGISSSSNKEFLNHWRAANDFYKNEMANRVKTDFAQSLLRKEMPTEAYRYMGNASHIRELKRILGPQPAAKEAIDALKRTKLQEIIEDKVISPDGRMNFASFSNLFHRRSGQQELFQELLGKESYQDMKNLADLATEFVKSGRKGTYLSEKEMYSGKINPISSLIGSLFGGGSIFALGGSKPSALVGAATGTTMATFSPLLMSKLISNPRYTNAALKYIKAEAQGNQSQANQNSRILQTIFNKTAREQATRSAFYEEQNAMDYERRKADQYKSLERFANIMKAQQQNPQESSLESLPQEKGTRLGDYLIKYDDEGNLLMEDFPEEG